MKLNMVFNQKHKSWSAKQDNCLFVLSKSFDASDYEGDQEYMIIRQLGNHPQGFIVEPVTENHILVSHNGFECSGGMCQTTARVLSPDEIGWITPGRCQDILFETSNINIAFYKGEKSRPTIKGYIYILKGERRGSGLPSISDVDLKKVKDTSNWRKQYLNKYK